jgi:ABC-type Fe3+ transport system permease subunit
VYGEIESYNPQGATSVSLIVLLVSFFALMLLERLTRPAGERLPAFFKRRRAAEPFQSSLQPAGR